MEAAFGVNDAVAAGRGARKLDRRLDTFAAAAAEINFLQSIACKLTYTFRQFAGDLRNVALQHRRAALIQLVLEGLHYIRMVVAGVVNAIAGEEVQDAPAVF